MKRKLSKRKNADEVKLPKSLLNPLCDWLIDNFEEDETVLLRIVAGDSERVLSFNMHIEVNLVINLKES